MNDMHTSAQPSTAAVPAPTVPTNLVVLRGRVRGGPMRRELPSGSIVVQFDVATTIPDGARLNTTAVPVAWTDPTDAACGAVIDGIEVVVIGTVRRRFFRAGGATQSRTEVVADVVLPARRQRQVVKALGAIADLGTRSGG